MIYSNIIPTETEKLIAPEIPAGDIEAWDNPNPNDKAEILRYYAGFGIIPIDTRLAIQPKPILSPVENLTPIANEIKDWQVELSLKEKGILFVYNSKTKILFIISFISFLLKFYDSLNKIKGDNMNTDKTTTYIGIAKFVLYVIAGLGVIFGVGVPADIFTQISSMTTISGAALIVGGLLSCGAGYYTNKMNKKV